MPTDLISVTSDALSPETRVLRFAGHEAISRAYSFEIYLLLPHDASGDLDMDSVLLQPATLNLHRDDASVRTKIHGIWSSLELVHELHGDAVYRGVLVPKFWQLTLTEHSHIYTDITVPDMIRKVLQMGGLAGADFELRISKPHPQMEHITQYQESYFDFVTRWMEREGIYYYFEHGDSKEKLIVTDDKSFQERFAEGTVRYVLPGADDGSIPEGLESFTYRRTALPSQVRLEDYDYLRPTVDLEGTASVASSGKGQVSRWADNAKDGGDARRLAGLRSQELLAKQARYRGAGRVFDLRTGYKFELEEHPRGAFNAEYLVVELEHMGSNAVGQELGSIAKMLGADPVKSVYRVEVVAISSDVQFRPERVTPTPRIYGYENAIVDGPIDSDYAQIDDHGRYKVKVHFDESDLDQGKASTWIRMMQPHGGSPEGFHFPLRKDTEVLLLFLGGDPDRPVIAGVVPNATTPSPVVGDNHTMNILHTGGDNHMEMQDQAGSQHIRIVSPTENSHLHLGAPRNGWHMHLHTEGHGRVETGGHLHIEVRGGNSKTEHVVGNVTEDYDSDHTCTVDGDHDQTIGGDHSQDVTGDHDTTVGGDHSHTTNGDSSEETKGEKKYKVVGGVKWEIEADEDKHVMGSTTETRQGNETSTTMGNKTDTVNGNNSESISGSDTSSVVGMKTEIAIGGSFEMDMSVAMEIFMGFKGEFTLSGEASLGVGAKFECFTGAQVEIVNGSKTETNNGISTEINDGVTIELNNGVKLENHAAVHVEDAPLWMKNHGFNVDMAGLHVVD